MFLVYNKVIGNWLAIDPCILFLGGRRRKEWNVVLYATAELLWWLIATSA
jgi:hypothetical protein